MKHTRSSPVAGPGDGRATSASGTRWVRVRAGRPGPGGALAVAVLVATTLVASGCGSSHHQLSAPATTTPAATTAPPSTAPATTSTTVPADPYAVPPTITIAYVQTVLDALNHVYGNAVRIEAATHSFPRSIIAILRALYDDPQYELQVEVFSQALSTSSFLTLKPTPGDRTTQILQMTSASTTCIDLDTSANYAAVSTKPEPPSALYLVLKPKPTANDPGKINPTPWAISYEMRDQPASGDAC